jgi:hypothetical protein
MTIVETSLFLVVVVTVAGMLVKAYEWRQDVLYGPYLRRVDESRR